MKVLEKVLKEIDESATHTRAFERRMGCGN